MHFCAAVSQEESSSLAVEQVIAEARKSSGGKIDIVFAFLTAHHRDDAEAIVEKLWLELDPQALIGCCAEGVIGADKEVEREPGISLLAGDLPGVGLHPFHISPRDWRALLADPTALAARMGHGHQTRAVIGFGDPFTTPIDQLMDTMDRTMAESPLIGGMASAGRTAGGNVLFKNDAVYNDGFVGVSLSGEIDVQTVVSQGCRPIGKPLVITKSTDNVIKQLGGKPALAALSDLVKDLSKEDRDLIEENGIMIGRVISEYKDKFMRGDFLVRGLVGVDQDSGSVAVGDYVRVGQTVQFHVRDKRTAHEDLQWMLQPEKIGHPSGVLLFSCNGRGLRMFDEPGHDAGVAKSVMPEAAIAGFFAAGEIGPVGGKNFMHGHTASFALLRPTGK